MGYWIFLNKVSKSSNFYKSQKFSFMIKNAFIFYFAHFKATPGDFSPKNRFPSDRPILPIFGVSGCQKMWVFRYFRKNYKKSDNSVKAKIFQS